ncbi:MAG: Asp-tRNA(Asn)/Glu-tRNA(Gln) amidotransferase subunit GatA [Pirellulaceae bacterium]
MTTAGWTAAELVKRLVAKEISSREVCQSYLQQIERHDSQVGAFLHVDADQVIEQAQRVDDRRARGEELGALAGLPVAVKDLLCTRGERTTCASRMLQEFRPPYDATAIARLRAADGIILGKTNLDEFAMGGSTENSGLGVTRNPWDLRCVPGGSSGGAAASVAASMAPLSLGTDTGGSIRQPASYCGVVGLKPTYGRVSRYGLVAFASSLDQIGPLAHTVEDVALLLDAIAGHDPLDSTSAPAAYEPCWESVSRPLEGLRIGLVPEHYGDGLDEEVAQAVREAIGVYQSLGAKVVDVHLPHSRYGIATYYVIAPCEASSNLARYDGVHYGYRTDEAAMLAELSEERAGKSSQQLDDIDSPLVRLYRRSRSEGFGAEVKRRIMLGTYALSAGYYDAYYLKALKVRRLIRRDLDAAFEQVDFIAGPVAPGTAFELGACSDDPLSMYLVDLYTVSANLAGIPGMSLPCGFSRAGMPIGLQLLARPFDESRLLRAGYMYQSATDWHTRRPEIGKVS